MQKESKILEGHLMPDHVHMLISIPPKYAVLQVVGFIKGKSAIHMARVYGERGSCATAAGPKNIRLNTTTNVVLSICVLRFRRPICEARTTTFSLPVSDGGSDPCQVEQGNRAGRRGSAHAGLY